MFLRRFGPLFSAVKESTGIVGLDVVPRAREVLIGLYQQTLDAVQVIPQEAVYRQSVEKLTRHRLKVCEEEKDWPQIEEKIQNGQIEELIAQAKDELDLIPKMAEWKPWAVPDDYSIPMVEENNAIPPHIPVHFPRDAKFESVFPPKPEEKPEVTQ